MSNPIIHHDCCRCARCGSTDRRTAEERLHDLIPEGLVLNPFPVKCDFCSTPCNNNWCCVKE